MENSPIVRMTRVTSFHSLLKPSAHIVRIASLESANVLETASAQQISRSSQSLGGEPAAAVYPGAFPDCIIKEYVRSRCCKPSEHAPTIIIIVKTLANGQQASLYQLRRYVTPVSLRYSIGIAMCGQSAIVAHSFELFPHKASAQVT